MLLLVSGGLSKASRGLAATVVVAVNGGVEPLQRRKSGAPSSGYLHPISFSVTQFQTVKIKATLATPQPHPMCSAQLGKLF